MNLVAGIINFENWWCFAGGLLYSRKAIIELLKKQTIQEKVYAIFDFILIIFKKQPCLLSADSRL